MADYHQLGDPFDVESKPLIYEIRLHDLLTDINPESFGLSSSDVESVDPNYFFITSGDALLKSIQLCKALILLHSKINSGSNNKIKRYKKAVKDCINDAKKLIELLEEAKGGDIFLETEFSVDSKLLCVCKNPRIKQSKS